MGRGVAAESRLTLTVCVIPRRRQRSTFTATCHRRRLRVPRHRPPDPHQQRRRSDRVLFSPRGSAPQAPPLPCSPSTSDNFVDKHRPGGTSIGDFVRVERRQDLDIRERTGIRTSMLSGGVAASNALPEDRSASGPALWACLLTRFQPSVTGVRSSPPRARLDRPERARRLGFLRTHRASRPVR